MKKAVYIGQQKFEPMTITETKQLAKQHCELYPGRPAKYTIFDADKHRRINYYY